MKKKLIDMNYIFDIHQEFLECHSIGQKYFDDDICIDKIINHFNFLFEMYYSNGR